MVQVVLISGKQGSGKSTLTRELMRLFPEAQEFKFAGPIYQIHDYARTMLDALGVEIPPNLKAKDGPLLQYLGTEWGRKSIADDVWVKCAQGAVRNYLRNSVGRVVAVFSDCRFKNEFHAFPDALTIRLECDRDARKARAEMWRDNENHPSEVDLDGYAYDGKFDFVIDSLKSDVGECVQRIAVALDDKAWNAKKLER